MLALKKIFFMRPYINTFEYHINIVVHREVRRLSVKFVDRLKFQ
jgi:hypothetical protein